MVVYLRQILIAAIFFVSFAALGMISYLQVVSKEETTSEGLLIPGKRYFEIFSGEACVGFLSYDFLYDGTFELLLNGFLRVQYEGENLPFSIDLSAYFNALGQMGMMLFKIKSSDLNLQLRLKDIRPIKLSAKGQVAGHKLDFTRTVQGPVEIIEVSPNRFAFNYLDYDTAYDSFLRVGGKSLFSKLNVRWVERSFASEACLENNTDALDLSAVSNIINQLQFPLRGIKNNAFDAP